MKFPGKAPWPPSPVRRRAPRSWLTAAILVAGWLMALGLPTIEPLMRDDRATLLIGLTGLGLLGAGLLVKSGRPGLALLHAGVLATLVCLPWRL